ncbi:MAG: CRISPR-associated endoribonuclease Cas2 [Planctomycetes bacterium]|nr:CRISPR-associated endoribonuclease Cas2 [Planctomycetota bacterium]
MPGSDINLSGYRAMWLFAMFDLPVDDKVARRLYTRFRKKLVEQGFVMLQYSVYARYCGSEEASETHRKAVRRSIPPDGRVRILSVTDAQFAKMEVFRGPKRVPAEAPPEQLALF